MDLRERNTVDLRLCCGHMDTKVTVDLREEGATVDLREEGATVDLREKVQPWTLDRGESATVDLRRRCNRGPEKKVQPWT